MATAPSTTDLVQLETVRDGVIILKDGSLRAVVQINAINFELRSSDEQVAIIQQFQAFLNSVDFPLQIIVHSRKFDISTYLATIQNAATQLTNELLKVQAQEYMRFVGELSDLANIMSKNFYIALSFSVLPTSDAQGGVLSGIKSLFKKKTPQPGGPTTEQLAGYRAQLQQRADIVIGGLSGMGLQGHLMEHDELVALFSGLYNPVVPQKQAA
jgi:type IV secretory pathway VirB4 component